jgi:alpha-ketoglutarate-dependent taurine dioxygenase
MNVCSIQRLPECGDGDTVFCDLIAAYDTLDDDTKARIEGLK